jgi:hypothetical protein
MPINASKATFWKPRKSHRLSEPDIAFIKLLQLLIGSTVIADPKRRAGLDRILSEFRKHFLRTGKETAAAVVEGVRIRSTDSKSQPATLTRKKC